jgi:sugar fermentation stimulation protein A
MCTPPRRVAFAALGAPIFRSMAARPLRHSSRIPATSSAIPPSSSSAPAPAPPPRTRNNASAQKSPALQAPVDPAVAYTIPSRLQRGVLEARYKRFLSDVTLPGEAGLVHAHCPNPGAMHGFGLDTQPPCLVSAAPDGSKRKMPFTLEAILVDGATWVGCNTQMPNTVVGEWLGARGADALSVFGEYESVRREVVYGSDGKSRVDFLLEFGEGVLPLYLEVKNVTMTWVDGQKRVAVFPDCKTVRGQKHLVELALMAKSGLARSCVLYFINRSDVDSFAPCTIDAKYVALFDAATEAGVEAVPIIFQFRFNEETGEASFAFCRRLPVHGRSGP